MSATHNRSGYTLTVGQASQGANAGPEKGALPRSYRLGRAGGDGCFVERYVTIKLG
jgi:hypothetical protein